MRRTFTAIALAVLAQGAAAQDTRALAEGYVALPANQEMMDAMLGADAMAAQFAAGLPAGIELTEDQLARIGEVMAGAMGPLRPRMEDLMIEVSAATFTEAELRALTEFYSSPEGASVLVKTQGYFQQVMAELTPEIVGAMEAVNPEVIAIVTEGQ